MIQEEPDAIATVSTRIAGGGACWQVDPIGTDRRTVGGLCRFEGCQVLPRTNVLLGLQPSEHAVSARHNMGHHGMLGQVGRCTTESDGLQVVYEDVERSHACGSDLHEQLQIPAAEVPAIEVQQVLQAQEEVADKCLVAFSAVRPV